MMQFKIEEKETYKRTQLTVTAFRTKSIFTVTASVVDPEGANQTGSDNMGIRQDGPAPVGVGPRATV